MNLVTGQYKRILALMLCFVMLTCSMEGAILADRQVFAAQEKTITLYTGDWSTGKSSYDIDTSFGLDTLVTPAYATGYSISWKSSDPGIAKVDSHGRVLALKKGTCVITAICSWNGQTVSDSITVNVKVGNDPSGTFFFNSVDQTDQSPDGTDDAAGSTAGHIEQSLEHEHVEGELLVTFDDGTKNSEIKKTLAGHEAGFEQVTELGEDEKVALASAESEESLKEVMQSLSSDKRVLSVQPNYVYRLDEAASPYDGSDPDSNKDGQYFHGLIDTAGAWALLEKNGISQTTTVGIIDSGVAPAHPDLAENLLLENGQFRKYKGKQYTLTDIATISHGTHVAGIIGAVYGNGEGVAGVASGKDNNYCRMLPVCVVNDNKTIDSYSVVSGIQFAADSGAKVINMSFGSDAKDRNVGKCVSDCYYNKGIVFVSSAGNKERSELNYDPSRLECMNFPADMKEVISVCNIDSEGNKSNSSYSGLAKDISAPGTSIYSTLFTRTLGKYKYTYGSQSGTSMAAPMVSGVAALILDAYPDLTPEEVRNIICATAYETEDDYYKSNEIGYGRVDARACVETAYKAREHAQPGSSYKKSISSRLGFSIKAYYAGEPEPYPPLYQIVTGVKTIYSFSKVRSFKAKPAKRKIRLSFKKSTLTKTIRTTTMSQYITGAEDEKTTDESTSTKADIKYQIRLRYRGKTRYFYTTARNRKTGSIKVSVRGNTIKIAVRKFRRGRLKKGKTYYVAVRPYKKTDGKMIPGKWSKTLKVKVK